MDYFVSTSLSNSEKIQKTVLSELYISTSEKTWAISNNAKEKALQSKSKIWMGIQRTYKKSWKFERIEATKCLPRMKQ